MKPRKKDMREKAGKLMFQAPTGRIVFQSEGTRMGSKPAASGRQREQSKEEALKSTLREGRNPVPEIMPVMVWRLRQYV